MCDKFENQGGCVEFQKGQLIVVNGNVCIYEGLEAGDFSDEMFHKVYEVDIDESGHLICTNEAMYVKENELANKNAYFTRKQWRGIVECILCQNHENISKEDSEKIATTIVDDFITRGVPLIHNIEERVAEYI